jgi:hypothetical protein
MVDVRLDEKATKIEKIQASDIWLRSGNGGPWEHKPQGPKGPGTIQNILNPNEPIGEKVLSFFEPVSGWLHAGGALGEVVNRFDGHHEETTGAATSATSGTPASSADSKNENNSSQSANQEQKPD